MANGLFEEIRESDLMRHELILSDNILLLRNIFTVEKVTKITFYVDKSNKVF